MPRQHVENTKEFCSENEAKRANKHANRRIISWPPFWNKVYMHGQNKLNVLMFNLCVIMRYSHPSRAAVVRVKSKTLGWFVRLGREQQKWSTIKRERRLRIMLFTWSYACQVLQYLAFLSSPFCVNALLNLAIIELLTRHVSSVQMNWQNPTCTKICCCVVSRRMIVLNEFKEGKKRPGF